MEKRSFRRGMDQVQMARVRIVRAEIIRLLGFKSDNRMSWSQRLNGKVYFSVAEIEAIEKVFAAEGITEVWS